MNKLNISSVLPSVNRNVKFVVTLFILLIIPLSCGWKEINLNCRDDDSSAIEWWYINKPPSAGKPYYERGRNFTFINPSTRGRWRVSRKYITGTTMLQNTLWPIYRPTYKDYLAIAIYDQRKGEPGFADSVARGVLMADEVAGVWIYHTVPGLVNRWKDRPMFPENETVNGHVLMCLSLSLDAVNAIVHNIRKTHPKVTYKKIPKKVQHLLPEWDFLETPIIGKKLKPLNFETRDGGLHVEHLVRRPGDRHSLYQRFARSKNIVLDVFGQSDSDYVTSICNKYSVRNIDSISLKLPDSVRYLRSGRHGMWFAVSTGVHWQSQGSAPQQYWSCISNLDKEYRSAGGDLLCVKNYKVWLTFDNLKVSEPSCL